MPYNKWCPIYLTPAVFTLPIPRAEQQAASHNNGYSMAAGRADRFKPVGGGCGPIYDISNMRKSSLRENIHTAKKFAPMNTLYTLYIIVVGCIILYLFVCNRRSCRHHALRQQYTSLLISTLFDDFPAKEPLSEIYTLKNRTILAQSVHTLISHTYGCNNLELKQLIRDNNLSRRILRQLPAASVHRKCRLLSQLSSLIDTDPQGYSVLEKYLRHDNHNLRIGALIALLAANPSKAANTLSAIEFRLQPLDIMRIISLIRQGRITVALEPLFESRNRNLLMLSMALVRTFGIGIVDKQLYNIIRAEQDPDLIFDAIYTLTYLKRPLRHRIIKECIASMPELQRKRLCRHLSVEGYSMQSINAILPHPESLYAKRLITSFKRQLLQPQAI